MAHLAMKLIFLAVAFANGTPPGPEAVSVPSGAASHKKQAIKLGYITGSASSGSRFFGRPGALISGALTFALDQINGNTSVLPNHTLDFIVAETYGMESESIKQTVLLLNQGIAAYIGPQETCVHEGRIAAAFNLPMISYFCTETEVSDKNLYPTFARTKPTDSQVSKSVVSLLRMFKWKKVTFIHSNITNGTADDIHSTLESHGITVTFRKVYPAPYFHQHMINPFVKIIQETFLETRIYVMLGAPYDFVGLMDNLQDRGLLDTGEYFVAGVCLEPYDPNSPGALLEGVFDNDVTERSALAFRHFVGLIHSPPVQPGYKAFQKIVDEYLEKHPFNFTNPLGSKSILRRIRPEAAYLYDAVWLYARAADRVLREGGSLLDGRTIIGYIQNETYQSAFGYLSRINSKGDTEGNFSLIVRKATKDGWGMFPVGNFLLTFDSDDIPTFQFYSNETIHWIAGKPPLDEPECGFHYERCIPPISYTKEVIAGIAGGLILIGVIVGYLIYSNLKQLKNWNWRYEQDLASLLWKIDYKDIKFGEQLSQGFSQGYGPRAKTNPMCRSPSQISLISQTDVDFRQLFTHVGTYRGTIVAIRRVNKKHVELTRSVRKELKTMRELRHDNVNPFIGACIDSPSILIVTAYCAKGSLQDILENDDFQLDSMFIASLVHDIVRGMIYIHESEIKSHGKLKSSNCVVDSRWVLKITDFGLHEFLKGAQDDMGEYAFYRNLLWRSPELLRHSAPAWGTQEGDVYSFAIIMFEIYGRKGPYGDSSLSPKEIVGRVRYNDGDVPFRPRLSELGKSPKVVTDLIKECWDEDPHKRPDFKLIRSRLKPLQKGMKANILDNMLAMMEKYADNLEALVEERTDQLIEEKKKTEELLHEMLPRSVADQLMRGKRVEADTFDSVTIYFSDICGFTAMSSESTPMQVVDLLNDLYTLFDSTIEYYDVYKVETIGDAYMVVSGLPKTNGIQHAALKIHCSYECKKLLDQLEGYILEERGVTRLKGKGEVLTYWLTGEERERRPRQVRPDTTETSQTSSAAGSFRRPRVGQPSFDKSLDWSPSVSRQERAAQANGDLSGRSGLSFLQPYGLLVGPSSQELLRRSSSRRRRLKFKVGSEDDEVREPREDGTGPAAGGGVGEEKKEADGVHLAHHVVETTPLILRKHDMVGEDNASYNLRCTSRV